MAIYELVPAKPTDFARCMEILNTGREFQRAQGFVQWPDGFPTEESVHQDIVFSRGYVLTVDEEIAAYLSISFDGDPSYPHIQGTWHQDTPHAVLHRVAIDAAYRGIGLTSTLFRLIEAFCVSKGIFYIRIDTHADNKRMQHVLAKNGFAYCGTVLQETGERMAFDKTLTT